MAACPTPPDSGEAATLAAAFRGLLEAYGGVPVLAGLLAGAPPGVRENALSTAPRPALLPAVTPEPASNDDRIERLRDLESQARACQACRLHQGRQNVAFARGTPHADLMLVGEGPGAEEDRQGIPFVGPAGQLLDKIIAAMGYGREDVYIANVVKCRPPGNRTPLPDESAACMPFLREQISRVRPRVIVALGATAAQALLGVQSSIGRLRGRVHRQDGIPIVATYHPAYLLRTPSAKKLVWEDVQQAMAILKASGEGEPTGSLP